MLLSGHLGSLLFRSLVWGPQFGVGRRASPRFFPGASRVSAEREGVDRAQAECLRRGRGRYYFRRLRFPRRWPNTVQAHIAYISEMYLETGGILFREYCFGGENSLSSSPNSVSSVGNSVSSLSHTKNRLRGTH